MSMDNLNEQFNNILTQYQTTYQEYINNLNSNNNNLIAVPNTSYDSQNTINTIPNSTLDTCQTSCAANSSCTGATFDLTNNNCTLNSGIGNLVSNSNTSSIVQQNMYYSYQLQQLNQQLLSLNQQMMEAANTYTSEYQANQQQSQQYQSMIQQNSNILNQERAEISKMLREYEVINQAYDNTSINVTSNYYSYVALLLITILLIFLLIKFSITDEQRGGGNSFKREGLFLFSIIVVFLGLSKIYNNYNLYIFVSILAFAYLIAKIKINQH